MTSLRPTSRRSSINSLFLSTRSDSGSLGANALFGSSVGSGGVGSGGGRVPLTRPRRSPSLSSATRSPLTSSAVSGGAGEWLRHSSLPGGGASAAGAAATSSPLTFGRRAVTGSVNSSLAPPVATRRRARSRSVQRFTLPMTSRSVGSSSAAVGHSQPLLPPSIPSAPTRLSRSASSLLLTSARLRASHDQLASQLMGGGSGSGATSRSSPSSGYGSTSTLNCCPSDELSAAESSAASSRSGGVSRASTPADNTAHNGVVDYKKLYEEAIQENERLRVKLALAEEESREAKSQADRSTQMANARVAALECDKREHRTLDRKLAEMEEELKNLRTANQRLLDENGALIRVISKLSK